MDGPANDLMLGTAFRKIPASVRKETALDNVPQAVPALLRSTARATPLEAACIDAHQAYDVSRWRNNVPPPLRQGQRPVGISFSEKRKRTSAQLEDHMISERKRRRALKDTYASLAKALPTHLLGQKRDQMSVLRATRAWFADAAKRGGLHSLPAYVRSSDCAPTSASGATASGRSNSGAQTDAPAPRRARFSSVMLSVAAPIAFVDRDGSVVKCNAAFAAASQLPPADVAHLVDVLDARSVAEVMDRLTSRTPAQRTFLWVRLRVVEGTVRALVSHLPRSGRFCVALCADRLAQSRGAEGVAFPASEETARELPRESAFGARGNATAVPAALLNIGLDDGGYGSGFLSTAPVTPTWQVPAFEGDDLFCDVYATSPPPLAEPVGRDSLFSDLDLPRDTCFEQLSPKYWDSFSV